jgi:uncharacterized membrane protein
LFDGVRRNIFEKVENMIKFQIGLVIVNLILGIYVTYVVLPAALLAIFYILALDLAIYGLWIYYIMLYVRTAKRLKEKGMKIHGHGMI